MKPRQLALLAWALSATLRPGAVLAQGSPDAKRATTIERCAPDGADADRARAKLQAFTELLAATSLYGDPAPVQTAFDELLEEPCFEPARANAPRDLERDSLLGRKTWWADGGLDWLHSYLEPVARVVGQDAKGRDVSKRMIVFPPDQRTALTLEAAPRHALRSLLCPAADERCGAETSGWIRRAERAFEAQEVFETYEPSSLEPPSKQDFRQGLAECNRAATRAKKAQRFAQWYACVDAARRGHDVFPLGRFKAPSTGWLVVRGRRGHYGFCDEVRAYDLATGSAYVTSSCSGLSLRNDGSVDFGHTDSKRAFRDQVGTLPVDNLREAAFMMFFADVVESDVRLSSEHVPLPAGVDPEWRSDWGFGTLGGMSSWGNSGQTLLAWAWVDGDRVIAEGQLTWPESCHAGENHAADLLSIAEDGFEDACPPARLPAKLVTGTTRSGVSSLDADPRARGVLEELLLGRLSRLRPPPRCERATKAPPAEQGR
jgi:hypothetical protein